jgi:hypothetical protein
MFIPKLEQYCPADGNVGGDVLFVPPEQSAGIIVK